MPRSKGAGSRQIRRPVNDPLDQIKDTGKGKQTQPGEIDDDATERIRSRNKEQSDLLKEVMSGG